MNYLPDAVENIPVRKDSYIEIGSEDLMKPRNFLISEESVWHPDLARISESQITDFVWKRSSDWSEMKNEGSRRKDG